MDYKDRKIPIVWTSPSGKAFELDNVGEISYSFKHYGNLITIMDKKRNDEDDSLSFLNKNNDKNNGNNNIQPSTLNIQQLRKGDIFEDLCTSGRTISLSIVFSGDNHDTESERFERAFAELGHSKLQLPYLERPIRVNAQTLNKKQDLVNNISSTIIEIEFIETRQNRGLTPYSQSTSKNTIQNNIDKKKQSNINAFTEFVKKLPLDKVQNVIETTLKNITKIANTISNIASGDMEAILRDLQANLLNNSLDGTILSQTSKLIDICFSINSSAVFATSLLENITKDITGITNNDNNNNQDLINNTGITKEELITNDFFITETFLSACNNTLNLIQTLNTKKESREVSEIIQELHDNYRNYYEHKLNQLDLLFKDTFVDEIDINAEIQTAVGHIIENSFNLKTEFNITLTEDANLIDLAYKYHKNEFRNNQNDIVDYIIRTNHITDEEFILLPKGRKVTLYL